jgi:hypothetical protein
VAARCIVATMWNGSKVYRTVGLSEADQQVSVDNLADEVVAATLSKMGIDITTMTPEEQRARLRSWPLQADLDAVAASLVAQNDGVPVKVRVLETAFIPRRQGPAGTMPK